MSINPYDKGASVRVTGPFRDVDTDNPIDPQNVSFIYKDPVGTVTTLVYGINPEIQRPTAGNYRVDINADISGMWHWRWVATGSGQTADQGQFYVRPTYT